MISLDLLGLLVWMAMWFIGCMLTIYFVENKAFAVNLGAFVGMACMVVQIIFFH
jgi:hypothetical protein